MEENFIPTRPEFLTKEWLLLVINQYRSIKKLSLLRSPDDIRDVVSTPHTLANNVFSNSYQVRVDFVCITCMGQESLQYCFYFKLAVQEPGHGQEIALEARLLESEVETLLGLVPRLRKMVREEGVEEQVGLAIPEMVYGSYSNSGEGVLVSMDLLSEGYTRPGPGPGLSLTQLVAALEALARVHATSACLIEKEGLESLVSQYPLLESHYYNCQAVFQSVEPLLKEFSGLVRRVPGFFTQFQRLEKWRERAWNTLSASRRRRPSPPLLCLTHGSPSQENLLVKDNNVFLVDWKLSDLGSPLSDVAFLILSSTEQATRTEHTRHLLETYHFTFCSTLQRLGYDAKVLWPGFSLSTVIQEYDRCLFGAFLQSACHLMQQMKTLEGTFRMNKEEEVGNSLRQVGRRVLDLVDEACQSSWSSSSSFSSCTNLVESCSSLTITLPAAQTSNG